MKVYAGLSRFLSHVVLAFTVRLSRRCAPRAGHMTHAELQRFLAGIARSRHRLAARDYALFSTLAYTGVRLSEVTGAVWADLDERRRLLLRSR